MFTYNCWCARSFTVLSVLTLLSVSIVGYRDNHRYQHEPGYKAKPILAFSGDRFDFPCLCSIIFHDKFVGACTIIKKNWVITSASNMNTPQDLIKQLEKSGIENPGRPQDLTGLRVFAGSTLIDPTVLEHQPQNQEKAVKAFVVIPNFDDVRVIYPTSNFSDQMVFDVVGVAYNICFLKVEDFAWTSYVLPIYVKYSRKGFSVLDSDFIRHITNTIEGLERDPFTNSSCRVGGWHRPTNRQIYHHVMYVPREECQQAYCSYNKRTCTHFPLKEYHVCFKSAYFSEPCPTDTGSVLICRTQVVGFRMFAILTTSLSCAESSLPCVYTTMPSVIEGFIKTIKNPFIMDRDVPPY